MMPPGMPGMVVPGMFNPMAGLPGLPPQQMLYMQQMMQSMAMQNPAGMQGLYVPMHPGGQPPMPAMQSGTIRMVQVRCVQWWMCPCPA